MRYWLMKSEPDVYSIDDLQRDRTSLWDGVRNYQARNFMREMHVGDRIFFYHSNTKPPGIVGLACVSAENLVDPTQFDAQSDYFDPKSSPEQPRWQTVEVEFVTKFANPITLDELRQTFTPDELTVVRQGNRLSVMPVDAAIAERLLAIAASPPSPMI
jgi:predicted RNA-binding protein with PUA-like domain